MKMISKTKSFTAFPDLSILPDIFKKFPLIQAAYIFGSVAEGRAGKGSDLDLAIIPLSPEIRRQRIDILYELTRAGFDKVDLVFLDTDDIVLKFEVIRLNRLIYRRKGFDRGQTYSLIVRQYFDFQPYLKTQREAYKRRILNGPGRGNQQAAS